MGAAMDGAIAAARRRAGAAVVARMTIEKGVRVLIKVWVERGR